MQFRFRLFFLHQISDPGLKLLELYLSRLGSEQASNEKTLTALTLVRCQVLSRSDASRVALASVWCRCVRKEIPWGPLLLLVFQLKLRWKLCASSIRTSIWSCNMAAVMGTTFDDMMGQVATLLSHFSLHFRSSQLVAVVFGSWSASLITRPCLLQLQPSFKHCRNSEAHSRRTANCCPEAPRAQSAQDVVPASWRLTPQAKQVLLLCMSGTIPNTDWRNSKKASGGAGKGLWIGQV